MPSKNKKRKVNATGRNEYVRFVKLDHWILKSAAYRLLSPTARALLVEFMFQYNGSNNGMLFMSQREAAKALGLSTHQTAAKYINELLDRGFLDVVVKGSFDNKQSLATVYRLTMWAVGNEKGVGTKEFASLKLTDEEKARVEKNTPAWMVSRPTGLQNLPVGFADVAKNSALH